MVCLLVLPIADVGCLGNGRPEMSNAVRPRLIR